MTKTIAVAGKGGTGKTTIAALLIHILSRRGTVLAVDADPSCNLHMALGMELDDTVGDVREEFARAIKERRLEAGVPKQDYLELKVRQAVVESAQIDLLVMGRPEGPGCYCAANNALRRYVDDIARGYAYVVMDCEAGLEHISRRTTRDIDVLLLVSDPSMRGLVTAVRARDLMQELRTSAGKAGLVFNRSRGGVPETIASAARESGLETLAVIPEDPAVLAMDAEGLPVTRLSPDSPFVRAVEGLVASLHL